MNDPKRLLESLDDEFGRELLHAASTELPEGKGMQRTLAALGAGVVTATAASEVAAAIGGAGAGAAAVGAPAANLGAAIGTAATGAGSVGAAAAGGVAGGSAAASAVAAKSTVALVVAKWVGVTTLASATVVGAVHLTEPDQPAASVVIDGQQSAAGEVTETKAPAAQPETALGAVDEEQDSEGPTVAPVPEVQVEPVPGMLAEGSTTEGSANEVPRAQPIARQRLPRPSEGGGPAAKQTSASELDPVVDATELPLSPPDPLAAFEDLSAEQVVEPVEVSPSELLEEVKLIDRARASVKAGNAGAALGALQEHARRFPRGRLLPEAMFLRMRAQLAAGRQAQARRTAANILKWYPHGPHAGKAREVLGSAHPEKDGHNK